MVPCTPQFYYTKVGCKGVLVARTCFRDVTLTSMYLNYSSSAQGYDDTPTSAVATKIKVTDNTVTVYD